MALHRSHSQNCIESPWLNDQWYVLGVLNDANGVVTEAE